MQAQRKYALPKGEAVNFISIHNNSIYLGTEGALLHLVDRNFESIPALNAAEQLSCSFTYKDTLWVGTSKGNIYYLKGGQLHLHDFNARRFYFPITKLGFTRKGIMWLATKNGVYYLDKKWNKISETEGLPDNNCNDALCIQDTLIVATDRGVVCINANNKFEIFNKLNQNNGLADNLVQHLSILNQSIILFHEYENTTSINKKGQILSDSLAAHSNEAFKLTTSQAYGYINSSEGLVVKNGQQNLLQKPLIKNGKVCVDKYGDFWLATQDTLYFFTTQHLNANKVKRAGEIHALAMNDSITAYAFDNQVVVNNAKFKLPITASITALSLQQKGAFIVGTLGNGCYYYNGSMNPILDTFKQLNITNLNCVNDTLFASALEGVFTYKYNGKQYQALSMPWQSLLPLKYIYGVSKDVQSDIWIASDGDGVFQVSNGKLINHDKVYSFPAKTAYCIRQVANQVFASVADNKVYKFKEGKWELLLKAHTGETFCPTIQVLNNHLYILSSLGIYKYDVVGNSGVQFYYFQDLFNKINTNDINVFAINNTSVAFVNNGALESLNLDYLESLALSTSVSELIIGNVKHYDNFPKELQPDENSLQLILHTNYYPGLNNINYKYRLVGLNNHWENTTDKKLTFLKLRPGKYTFQLVPVINGIPFYEQTFVYDFKILSPILQRPWFILLSIVAILAAVFYFYKRRTVQLKNQEAQKREKLNYEIKVLKSQINPHFLFNSFNSLIATINLDPEKAINYTQNLSDYFRHILKYQDQDTITLAEELDLLKRYFTLQQMRFEDSIELHLHEVLQQYTQYSIPPLSLQLLFENAIKHNAILANKPLQFKVSIKGAYLVCENEIRPKNSSVDSGGIGLVNINQRFITLFNKEIHYEEKNKHFIVSLPLVKI